PRAAEDPVVPRRFAGGGVVGVGLDAVVARAGEDCVVTAAREDRVADVQEGQRGRAVLVVRGALVVAPDAVVAGTAVEDVRPLQRDRGVGPLVEGAVVIADDDVVAATAVDDVVAAAADQGIVAAGLVVAAGGRGRQVGAVRAGAAVEGVVA